MKRNQQSLNRPLLDIAVLTAGRVDLFDKCINSILLEMKPEYRICVHNNGHPSAEYESIYKSLPDGSVIKRSNKNIGFGGGANIAIKSGNAPLVLFITDDIFLHSGTIDKLIKTMDDPTIGIAGYKLLFPEDSTETARPAGRVQHVGMAPNIRGDMLHPLIGWSPDNPKCHVSREVLAVTGATFIVRRDIFNKVGGFNPIYGVGYYEDMELCMAIRSIGARVYVNTEAVATHGVGQTMKSEETPPPIQKNALTFRSRWLQSLFWSEWEFW